MTTNHECYVSLEVAKLLKQADFNWEVQSYYSKLSRKQGKLLWLECGCLYKENININQNRYSAPTLYVAQRWLREEKLYNVLVDTGGYKNYEYFIDYHGVKEGPNYPFHEYNHNLICSTYEQALEVGIKKALEMILEERE